MSNSNFNICFDSTSNSVWVGNLANNTLSQMIGSTETLLTQFSLGIESPIALYSDGNYVWILSTNNNSYQISQLVIATSTLIMNIVSGNTATYLYSPVSIFSDGTKVWVTNYTTPTSNAPAGVGANGYVTYFPAQQYSTGGLTLSTVISDSTPLINGPVGITSNGTNVFIANSGNVSGDSSNRGVLRYTIASPSLVLYSAITTGYPYAITNNINNTLYVTSSYSTSTSDTNTSIYNVYKIVTNGTAPVTATIVSTVGGSLGDINLPLSITYDGTFAWVANIGNNSVTKIQDSSIINTVYLNNPISSITSGVINGVQYAWILSQSNSQGYMDIVYNINTQSSYSPDPTVSADSTYIWIADYNNSLIKQINSSTGILVNNINFNSPAGIYSDGTYVWVTSYSDNTLVRITISSSTLTLNTILTSANGLNKPIGVYNDGLNVWVVNNGINNGNLGQVTIYNTVTTSIRTVSNTLLQNGVDILTCGNLGTYVTTFTNSSGTAGGGNVVLINSMQSVTTVTNNNNNPFTGNFNTPAGITFDGTYAWVVNAAPVNNSNNNGLNSFYISKIQGTSVVNNYTISAYNTGYFFVPVGILYANNYLWVVNSGNNTITQLSTSSPTVAISSTSVGETPTNVVYDGVNNLFVINQSDASVSQIQLTNTSTVCFREGTRILCLDKENKEKYIPIEKIRKGTLVKTLLNDYVKVNLIGTSKMYNNGDKERSKNKLYKCTKEKYPELINDLYITGSHGILVDSITDVERKKMLEILPDIYITDDKYRLIACVDERAELHKEKGYFDIWHLALDNDNYYHNYGIFAEGLLVETCSKRYLTELANMKLID